jgi:hypothetical protein
MPVQTWPLAVEHFCVSYNASRKGDGTPWEKRHGAPFKGQRLPFGCLVDFMPSAARKVSQHKFEQPRRNLG